MRPRLLAITQAAYHPVSPAALLAAFLVVVVAGLALRAQRKRRQLIARLRAEWGASEPRSDFDWDLSSEAWKELDGSASGEAGTDDRTWSDLDLDAVLAWVDRTHTGLGSQQLYRRVRTGRSWSDDPSLDGLAARFRDRQDLREAVALALASAGKPVGRGLWIINRPELIQVRWWSWCFPVLALSMILSVLATPFEPAFLLGVFGLAGINMMVRMITSWQVPGILAPMGQMRTLIRTAEGLVRISGLEEARPAGLPEDLRRLRPLRMIASWISRDAFSRDEGSASFFEYLNLLLLLDANALLFGARHLRRLGGSVVRIACWIGDVDVALGIASLRAQPRQWCEPVWEESAHASVEGVWHPLLASPVENAAELMAGSGMIITGANASGKSTYIRAVGIAAILGRALNTCPATSWIGGHFRVRSLIAGHDDLSTGRSYYQVEADGVVELLNAAGSEEPTIFLLDELLRGTNSVDRLAAGEAILRALLDDGGHGQRHCVMIATHDSELATLIDYEYKPWHFRETITSQGLIFDYRRYEGSATTRTALALLEAAGAPKAVMEAARFRAESIERDTNASI
ncbi:MAG: hypothetical protein GEU90_19000 [Gemmatimonas sp.]|nr:hypothetical protein [Gemmatimonas sp.]